MSLSDVQSTATYLVKKEEFMRFVADNFFDRVVLEGRGEKGFVVVGVVHRQSIQEIYTLISQRSSIRYVKSPDVAHRLLVNMGVTEFDMDTTNWDLDCVFDPNKASQKCRQKKRLRETGQ